MKIVCDACTAKYSIADEKVAGKVFKIRCKKCENIIVVRGTTAAPAEAEQPANQSTKVFDNDQDAPDGGMSSADEGEWHVVIDQEQVGPMTSDEVRVRFGNGELDTESYIWKEGFADWERIPDVAEFADLEDAAAGGAASDNAAAPADDGGMFGTPVAAVAPAAAAATADTGGGLFGGGAGGGVDLFGGGGDAGSGVGSNDLFGNSAPNSDHTGEIAMSKEAEAQLKGQRNENSVLFSLGNLAALASDAPKAAPSVAPTPGVSNTGGSEGSGLIDIRSMASVYLADKGAAAAPGAGVGSADDLPVFSTSAFESASPVLMPTHSGGGDKKMMYTLLAVIAGLVVAAGILVVIVLGGDDDKSSDAVAGNTKVGDSTDLDTKPETDVKTDDQEPPTTADGNDGEDGTAEATTETPKTPVEAPTATETTAPVVAKPAANRPTKPLTRKEKRELAKAEKAKRAAAKEARANKPERTVPKETPSRGGSCDEITCLVDPGKACCKKYAKKAKTSSSSNSNLPERLSKPDVKAGISKVKGRVTSCGDKHNGRGIVTVRIKISGSGKVTSAAASGGNSGLRSCVSSAVKRAKFKKTQNGGSVNYPFRF